MKTIKIMKKTSILAMLCIGLMSCNSEIESLEFEEASEQSKSLESTVNYRHATGHDVDLGTAGNYTILSKSGITNVSPSLIQGNVGTSPITGAALLLTCDEVIPYGGSIHTVAAAGPLGCTTTNASGLTTAVGNMQAAYTAAAGLTNSLPDATFLNRKAGSIGGEILTPGVYTWGSALLIPSDITLDASATPSTDVWIFQVAGTLTMSNGVKMILDTGIDPENVFWQVSGAVTLGTNSEFVGTLLGKTSIAVQTNATVNGRLLAQTAVTLQKNIVWAGSGSAPTPPVVVAKVVVVPVAPTCDKAAPILGKAGNFAILSKSGITNVVSSPITGNVGTSPITGAALLLTCGEVDPLTGKIYTVDAAGPIACRVTDASGLSTAVGNMQRAYTDLAGRCNPDFTNVAIGVGSKLKPGVHKWTSALLIPGNIELDSNGETNPVWIFQVAGTLTMSNAARIGFTTTGDADDVFWQVAGAVTLGTTSHFEGTLLGKTSIAVQTDASVNGRLLAQTAVTLQKNTIVGATGTSVPL